MKDTKAHGLTILPCVTMTVGEASVYKAHQTAHIKARKERAAKQRQDRRGDAAKSVSFRVDKLAEEEGQQLGACASSMSGTYSPVNWEDACVLLGTSQSEGCIGLVTMVIMMSSPGFCQFWPPEG